MISTTRYTTSNGLEMNTLRISHSWTVIHLMLHMSRLWSKWMKTHWWISMTWAKFSWGRVQSLDIQHVLISYRTQYLISCTRLPALRINANPLRRCPSNWSTLTIGWSVTDWWSRQKRPMPSSTILSLYQTAPNSVSDSDAPQKTDSTS